MSKAKIYDLLAQMAVVFGKTEPSQRLQYYATELESYNFQSVQAALRIHAREKNFFPSLAEVIEGITKIEAPANDATEVAQVLIAATYRFGEYRANDAKEHLGPDLWSIVENWGGWLSLCRFNESQIPTIRAQLRAMVEAKNKKTKFEIQTKGVPEIECQQGPKMIGDLVCGYGQSWQGPSLLGQSENTNGD